MANRKKIDMGKGFIFISLLFLGLFFGIKKSEAQDSFIGKWIVSSPSMNIIIPAYGEFNYYYENEFSTAFNGTGTSMGLTTISIPSGYPEGVYTVVLTPIGTDPLHRIAFNGELAYNPNNFVALTQWGDIEWSSMDGMFWGCMMFTLTASDTPNLESVTSVKSMFRQTLLFNTPINHWDVSPLTDMSEMFYGAYSFNQELDNWDVSQVTNMSGMFYAATNFDQALNDWDVSQVTDMSSMFEFNDTFNQYLNEWDVSQVTDMSSMFSGSAYNLPLNEWDVSQVTDMSSMFANNNVFNQTLNNWDVGNVLNMQSMFRGASVFNQPLYNWDVSQVTDMSSMFMNAIHFNQNIDDWDVSNVTNMQRMFMGMVVYNQPMNSWDVSQVTNMKLMFAHTNAFNQQLNSWDVSQVEDMSEMFYSSYSFNQDINSWDVSSVTNMSTMFGNTYSYNQPMDDWEMSQVTDINAMFSYATSFNQSLSNWHLYSINNANFFLEGSGMDCNNYTDALISWAADSETAVGVDAFNLFLDGEYKIEAIHAKDSLIVHFGWIGPFGDMLNEECPPPCSINDSIFYSGESSITSYEPPSIETTYQWINCADYTFISDAIDQTFTPEVSGNYAVIISKGDCVDTSACLEIEIELSVKEDSISHLEIYPNPAEDYITLSGLPSAGTIQIYDVFGRKLKEIESSGFQNIISLTELNQGIYFIKFMNREGIQFTLKFLKK